MSEQSIKWMDPEKDGNPKKSGNYLVTLQYELISDNGFNRQRMVEVKYFRPHDLTWFSGRRNRKDRWWGIGGAILIAWANFPEPYNPFIKLLQHQPSDSAS